MPGPSGGNLPMPRRDPGGRRKVPVALRIAADVCNVKRGGIRENMEHLPVSIPILLVFTIGPGWLQRASLHCAGSGPNGSGYLRMRLGRETSRTPAFAGKQKRFSTGLTGPVNFVGSKPPITSGAAMG